MSRTRHHGRLGSRWIWNEPKWWRRLMKHKKRRAALRQALSKPDLEEAIFPLDKKPWVYYW